MKKENIKQIYVFLQGNMFCHICLLHVANALSALREYIDAYGIDLNTKTVRVELKRDGISEKTLRTVINRALIAGAVPIAAEVTA
jgi:hypothetical protein